MIIICHIEIFLNIVFYFLYSLSYKISDYKERAWQRLCVKQVAGWIVLKCRWVSGRKNFFNRFRLRQRYFHVCCREWMIDLALFLILFRVGRDDNPEKYRLKRERKEQRQSYRESVPLHQLPVRIKILFDRFVQNDTRADGKVEAPPLFRHRNGHYLVRVIFQKFAREPRRFASE